MAIKGDVILDPLVNSFDILLTAPSFSLSGPTINPGVSTSETIGMEYKLHISIKSDILSALSLSIAPPRCLQSLATKPNGIPSILINPVTILFP